MTDYTCECGGCLCKAPPVYPCVGCDECGTIPTPVGQEAIPPAAHDMVDGVCKTCNKTQEMIDTPID